MKHTDDENLRRALTVLVDSVVIATGESRFYIARLAEVMLQDIQREEHRKTVRAMKAADEMEDEL